MKISLLLIVIAVLAMPVCAQNVCAKDPSKCCGATSFANCPKDGCGADKKLSLKKNKTDKPASGDVTHKTITEIANFTTPANWKANTSRTLLEKWGEGDALEVTLYLKTVKHYNSGAEACNCNLKLDDNNDFHLVLVAQKTDPESSSLTAEITPRLRPDGWTLSKIQALANKKAYVRLTGWAMLDTQHIGKPTPVRKTHWEIHPVTKFEVCTTTKSDCDSGNGWKKLEDIP